jgi:hypothetical protein
MQGNSYYTGRLHWFTDDVLSRIGTDSAAVVAMAKRPDVQSALEKTTARLERRLTEIETLARDNRRILDVQFTRIAAIQADLDRVISHLKRDG